jgi:hypothetical protein
MAAQAIAKPVAPTGKAVTSIVPPPPMAPLMLEQVRAAEDLIAECESRVGVLVLAEAQGTKGATEALAALEAKTAAARAELARKTAAHKAAIVADRAAAEANAARIRALPPETLIAGITREKCADLCHEHGCALAGGIVPCMHPRVATPPAYQGDRWIAMTRLAASREIARQREARLFQEQNGHD